MAGHAQDHDFHIPKNNIWPPISCVGAGVAAFGLIAFLHHEDFGIGTLLGKFMIAGGLLVVLVGALQWFFTLIDESRERGYENAPRVLEIANRYGMVFFIVSEIMFFAAFFAAFFFLRNYQAAWPPANIDTLHITLPFINTMILLTSGVTITWAHHALLHNQRRTAIMTTAATFILGFIFLACQMYEYGHALFFMDSGVYGSTFYMLTGFHGFHVLVGSLMLVMLFKRLTEGDFTSKQHFYFEATAWYWHFVDVVWIGLFLVVYMF